MNIRTIVTISAFIFFTATTGMRAEDAAPLQEQSHIGTVKSSQTAGKYTYLQLDVDGKEVWVATEPKYLKVDVAPGDKVEYLGGVSMDNFQSKALKKTFDTILLISRIRVLKNGIPQDDYHKNAAADIKQITAPQEGEIERAKDGKTIGELFSESEKLKDQEVVLRVKVMKLSKKVLKKNWMTLQDGTGTPPDNKLTATTTETATPGDIIIVKGKLKTNVEIGAGYKYKILLEDTTIIK